MHEAGKIAQSTYCQLCKHEDSSSVNSNVAMVGLSHDPSPGDVGTGRSLELAGNHPSLTAEL